MKPMMGILGLVIVLAIAYHFYAIPFDAPGGRPPAQQIDVIGVQGDLISLAQAERIYFAANGSYATLDQLQQGGNPRFRGSIHRGYLFTIEIDGLKHFRITAKPADPSRTEWPSLTIDENQQISTANPHE